MTATLIGGPHRHDLIIFRGSEGTIPTFSAHCTCGWSSAYIHASERYAAEDHDFHLTTITQEANR